MRFRRREILSFYIQLGLCCKFETSIVFPRFVFTFEEFLKDAQVAQCSGLLGTKIKNGTPEDQTCGM